MTQADAVGAFGGQSVEKLAVLFFCVMLSSAASAVAAMQGLTFLPEILRFTVVQLLCFAPYGYLSLGLLLPEDLQRWVTRLYVAPASRAIAGPPDVSPMNRGDAAGATVGIPRRRVAATPQKYTSSPRGATPVALGRPLTYPFDD